MVLDYSCHFGALTCNISALALPVMPVLTATSPTASAARFAFTGALKLPEKGQKWLFFQQCST